MNINTNVFRRPGYLLAAIAVAVAALVPALTQLVNADQVSSRSIEMSDSTPSQTGVKYSVAFTTGATGPASSLVIDFCSNSSIIGGSCTAPVGMDMSTVTLTVGTSTTGWSLGSGSASQVRLTQGSGSALPVSTAVTFTLNGAQNPSGVGTFWARIYTYTNTTYGTYNNPDVTLSGGPGTYVDYGGFALSTVSLINISATVMETLTFCVNQSQPGNGCTSLTTPVNLTLGHGTPRVLDSSQVDTDDAYFQISTNALTGAVVRMKTHNTCAGLSRNGGTDNCPIAAVGTINSIGLAKFGMHLTSVAGGTGTVLPTTDYDGTTATNYGMIDNGTTGVQSTYGSAIANTNNTATANVNEHMTFGAKADVTTPAGVYTAAESLIATGTF